MNQVFVFVAPIHPENAICDFSFVNDLGAIVQDGDRLIDLGESRIEVEKSYIIQSIEYRKVRHEATGAEGWITWTDFDSYDNHPAHGMKPIH